MEQIASKKTKFLLAHHAITSFLVNEANLHD